MFNLTGREEIKFLSSLQFKRGQVTITTERVFLEAHDLSYPLKGGMSMLLNHPAHKDLSLHLLERYLISSCPVTIREQQITSHTWHKSN